MKKKISIIAAIVMLAILGVWLGTNNGSDINFFITEPLHMEHIERETLEFTYDTEETVYENGNDDDSLPTEEYIPEENTRQATPDFEDELSQAYNEYEDEPIPTGTINGEIYFSDINLSRLFLEPISDVLPSPRGYREVYYFFEGFQITAMSGLDGEASIVNIWPPYLNNLTVNEIMLDNDMTRMDLHALFGAPLENYECFRYRISNPVGDFVLIFRFVYPDAEATIQSISIS